MPTTSLEDVITFSCGIGQSYREAEAAVSTAKKIKSTRPVPQRGLYNVVVYEGPPIKDGQNKLSNAQAYQRILRLAQRHYESEEDLTAAYSLGTDPRTGLLNKMGYETRRLELERMGITDGYYILFDGDNMKKTNDTKGHEYVDGLLENAGSAIVKYTRSGVERRVPDQQAPEHKNLRTRDRRPSSNQDIVAHRVNSDGGDEFLVFLPIGDIPITKIDAENLAVRLYNRMYSSQFDFLNKPHR